MMSSCDCCCGSGESQIVRSAELEQLASWSEIWINGSLLLLLQL